MSPTKQWLIIVFGGTTIMVITTVCGAAAGFSMFRYSDDPSRSLRELGIIDLFLYVFSGGVIGAVVGVPIWVWFVATWSVATKNQQNFRPGHHPANSLQR